MERLNQVPNPRVEVVRHQVLPEDEGRMIRDIIRSRLELSRGLLRKVLSSGGLSLNGKPAFMGNRARAGDLIVLSAEPSTSEDILPEQLPLDIFYEDEDLLIVAKPAGMVVHPTHGHYTSTLANAVVYHWQMNGERVRFRPLHRIDQETSGLLAIAKSHFASQKMSSRLKQYLNAREYTAIVDGIVEGEEFTVDAPIGRDPQQTHLRTVMASGKQAVTHAKVLETGQNATLVRLRLDTGRTHQIRVHMAYLGHPLLGDKLYGSQVPGLERHALHAGGLQVIHPRTNELLVFEQQLPEDLASFWQTISRNSDLAERIEYLSD